MKKYLFLLLLIAIGLTGCQADEGKAEDSTKDQIEEPAEKQDEDGVKQYDEWPEEEPVVEPEKPVIYLYPEEVTEVDVKLNFDGNLTCTYPEYNDGWSVIARPDGTLTDPATGNEYSYLFWEGVSNVEYDFTTGYVVKGEDTAKFLEKTLKEMGLTARESNEFIVYWLPRMQENPYNLISFQKEAYTKSAELNITPAPDSVLRVFMAYKAIEESIEIEEPVIEPFVRDGFTVVEWGGAEVE